MLEIRGWRPYISIVKLNYRVVQAWSAEDLDLKYGRLARSDVGGLAALLLLLLLPPPLYGWSV